MNRKPLLNDFKFIRILNWFLPYMEAAIIAVRFPDFKNSIAHLKCAKNIFSYFFFYDFNTGDAFYYIYSRSSRQQ